MSEWKDVEISEVIEEIAMGPFGSNIKVDNFINSGIPVLNGSNLQGFKLNENSFNFVSEEKADSLGRANAFRGDVIITHRGTLGQIVYIPFDSKYERYVISQSQFRLKLNHNIIRPDFLVYFFHTRLGQHRILMNASQVGVPALARPTSTFKKVCVPVPPLETQNEVMAILSSLDDKIPVNKKICENLEAQAQALFKHWFVDFAPFKDGKFVESELGLIPEGWSVGTLGDIAEFKRGKTITKSDVKEGLIPVVAGGLEPAYYHNQSNTSSRVITISGSGANAGFTKMYYQPVWASDCSFVDNASTSLLHTAYCYLLINKKKVDALQWGAAQPHVYAKDINKLPLAIAPLDVLNQFEEMISEMFDLIEVNDKETTRLATLRDTLLPKLMSGEIKVNEIEKSL